jgi:hypothetical protein
MGFGVARFNESDETISNQPNPNGGSETNGVFAFGFGLDVKVVSILSVRGEVRDFYADLPPLNVRALSERQHNALISAGACRFKRRLIVVLMETGNHTKAILCRAQAILQTGIRS